MSQSKLNVLFVCGYGVGSSAISAGLVKKSLDKLGVNSEVKHTAAGEVNNYNDWADIIAVSVKFAEIVNEDNYPEHDIVEVLNIMDGDGIAKDILEIATEKYPETISLDGGK